MVRDRNNEPIFSSGNFGVVFKVELEGEFRALKCFTREQPQRDQAYQVISQELQPQYPYIIPYRYYHDEITVFEHSTHYQFPVLLMDWVEGEMLSSSINRALRSQNTQALGLLREKFYDLCKWLLGQPFAHGDIKPDNIMINSDGELTLVDYDGVYLPQMKDWQQRELGTPWYQHPQRAQIPFSKEIDHYSMVVIYATLELLESGDQELIDHYLEESILFTPELILRGQDKIYNMCRERFGDGSGCFRALQSVSGVVEDIEQLFGDRQESVDTKTSLDQLRCYRDGVAAARKGDRWGYIDAQGFEVIPFMYDYAATFSQQIAAVSLAGRYGYIDRERRSLSGFKFEYAASFREGFGLVLWRGRYGYINSQGRMVIPARYDYAFSFSEGAACVRLGDSFGYIDGRGRWLVEPRFEYARSVREGYVSVEIDGHTEVIEFSLLTLGSRSRK